MQGRTLGGSGGDRDGLVEGGRGTARNGLGGRAQGDREAGVTGRDGRDGGVEVGQPIEDLARDLRGAHGAQVGASRGRGDLGGLATGIERGAREAGVHVDRQHLGTDTVERGDGVVDRLAVARVVTHGVTEPDDETGRVGPEADRAGADLVEGVDLVLGDVAAPARRDAVGGGDGRGGAGRQVGVDREGLGIPHVLVVGHGELGVRMGGLDRRDDGGQIRLHVADGGVHAGAYPQCRRHGDRADSLKRHARCRLIPAEVQEFSRERRG